MRAFPTGVFGSCLLPCAPTIGAVRGGGVKNCAPPLESEHKRAGCRKSVLIGCDRDHRRLAQFARWPRSQMSDLTVRRRRIGLVGCSTARSCRRGQPFGSANADPAQTSTDETAAETAPEPIKLHAPHFAASAAASNYRIIGGNREVKPIRRGRISETWPPLVRRPL